MKLIPLKSFSGYFAGDDGSIYSDQPIGIQVIGTLHKLKPNIQSSGKYLYVNLKNKDGRFITKRVHRLVCEAFHGTPISSVDTASHLDGNWKNNCPENLRWESLSFNHGRKKGHGTDDVGVKNSRAKIDLETLKEIRKLLIKGLTHKEIGNKFDLSRVFITKIANGYRYKDQGF